MPKETSSQEFWKGACNILSGFFRGIFMIGSSGSFSFSCALCLLPDLADISTEMIGCFPDSVQGSLHSGECTFQVPHSASTPPSLPPLFLVLAQSFPGSRPHISFCQGFPEPTCNAQITEFTHSFTYFIFGKTLSLRVRQLLLRVWLINRMFCTVP